MGVSAGCAHKAEAIRDSKIPHNQKAYQLLLSETYKTNKLALGVVVTTCYLHSTQSRITENIQDIARAQLRIDSVSHKGHRWWQYKAIAAIFFLLSDSIYVLFSILYRSYTANQIAYDGADFLRSVLFREGTGSNPILLQVGHRSPRPAVAHHPCFLYKSGPRPAQRQVRPGPPAGAGKAGWTASARASRAGSESGIQKKIIILQARDRHCHYS